MSVRINGRIIPKEHEPFFKQTYSNIYNDWLKRREDLNKEYEAMKPILIDFGIIQEPLLSKSNQISVTTLAPVQASGNNSLFRIRHHGNVHAMSYSYDKTWGWLRKSQYIIEEAGEPLTSNEIVEKMSLREPEISKEKLGNSVPATLSVASKEGKIHRELNEAGEYEYSLIMAVSN